MNDSKNKMVVGRLQKPYEGTVDPATWMHHNMFHRSVDEAFRTPTYAQAFWRCETEFEYGVRQLKEIMLGLVFMAGIAGIGYVVALAVMEVSK